MKISEYLRDKWLSAGIAVLTVFFLVMLLLVLGTPVPVTVLSAGLFVFSFGVMGACDCFRRKRYYDKVMDVWEALEEKNYLSGILEAPGFYEGRILHDIIKADEKYLNDVIDGQQKEMQEYKDYVETWSHEIKTPIAVERLILGNHPGPVSESLEEEVGKVESYVEQMLYFSKSGSLEADYLIQPVNLKALVSGAISKNRKMMVEASVFPRLENLDYTIAADAKWMEFIFGQLITNSVKYRRKEGKCLISFEAREEEGRMIVIAVEDNGIGIPSEDISRVFQKGFTGENGHRYKKSTGMGLYLCKKLCEKMGIQLELSSRQGEGTRLLFRVRRSE